MSGFHFAQDFLGAMGHLYLKTCSDATDALNATKAIMVEFDKICALPTSKVWSMHMDMLMILKRFSTLNVQVSGKHT